MRKHSSTSVSASSTSDASASRCSSRVCSPGCRRPSNRVLFFFKEKTAYEIGFGIPAEPLFRSEHGTMFTLALVRFPPTATKEIQYLNAKGALTYTDIAGDPVLYGNLPPREISMKDVFRSGDSSKKFKIAEGQWYRYAPSYVSPAYHLLEGFPFIQEPPSGDLQERVLIRHHDYDQCFQSVQLLQWN